MCFNSARSRTLTNSQNHDPGANYALQNNLWNMRNYLICLRLLWRRKGKLRAVCIRFWVFKHCVNEHFSYWLVNIMQWPPDYIPILADRARRLIQIRQEPKLLLGAKEFYRTRPIKFIEDWAVTYDPRNSGTDIPVIMPFVLFPRQLEFIEFLHACLLEPANGLIEKSRDMGATWLACAFSVWLWIFWNGAAVGWGSRKADLVDKLGDPDSIFEKMRILIRNFPKEFLPRGFDDQIHMSHMRILNPETGATITGDIGDNIGRGGRSLIYFKDESSHYIHPEMIEAALSGNARVQIDISSVHGIGTVFDRKIEAGVYWHPGKRLTKGRTNIFVMDWSDHPAKTQGWFDRTKAQAVAEGLQHIFAQEVERDRSASVEGTIIPAEWIRTAIDAHIKLNFEDNGLWGAGLDVADSGGDTNALAVRKGPILKSCDEWGERDTGLTARRAVRALMHIGTCALQYDCVGVGAGIKAETNRLIDEGLMPRNITLVPWNAGAEVLKPERRVIQGDSNSPLNKDFYANLKAQAWWELRRRFERTYRAINEPEFTYDPDELISLPSSLPLLRKIEKELSQPTASQGARLKMVVDKKPDGARSPNLADAIVMAFWPVGHAPFEISEAVRSWASVGPRY
jgi:phage terminase large subunit